MKSPKDRGHAVFHHQTTAMIPRGELWLGTRLLNQAGLADDVKGHIKIRNRLGMDVLGLPFSNEQTHNTSQGYRYFDGKAIKSAYEETDLFIMVVVDGPFQRMADKNGLMAILKGWIRNRSELENAYQKESRAVAASVEECLNYKLDAVVVADDLASDNAPYLNPSESGKLFMPFYMDTVEKIHDKGAYALFHCCGDFSAYIPDLVRCEFDGFAACQCERLDLVSLKKKYGARLTFMTGIRGDLFGTIPISAGAKVSLHKYLKELCRDGGFILSTSTGLFQTDYVKRIQELYYIADEMTFQ